MNKELENKNEKLIDLGYEVAEVYRNSITLRKELHDDDKTIVYCDIHFEEKTIEFSQSSNDGRSSAEPYAAMIEEMEAAIDILYAKSFTVNFGGYNV